MTPWLRALRVAGLLLVLATGTVPAAYTAYAAEPAPAASRAGSVPGEGRERPGRADPTPQDADEDEDQDEDPGEDQGGVDGEAEDQGTGADTTVTPTPSQNAAVPVRQSVLRPVPDEEPVLRIVPLGSGLILVGLGLGLAFVALRVRRG